MLLDFLRQLLGDGEIVFRGPPEPTSGRQRKTVDFLEDAFNLYRLDVAGPEISFDAEVALAAAELVRWASWFLVHHGAPAEEVDRCLTLSAPRYPAQHLSGDLLLRFLPQLQRRARAIAPDDPLTTNLTRVLREWPLAGVLSDIADAPLTGLDFGGHPGLRLLYAERLVGNEKPEWFPAQLDEVELVYHELGKRLPATRFIGTEGDAHDQR